MQQVALAYSDVNKRSSVSKEVSMRTLFGRVACAWATALVGVTAASGGRQRLHQLLAKLAKTAELERPAA
jgi:hypothetical protein